MAIDKGTEIKAKGGIYTAQIDERWYSEMYVDTIIHNRMHGSDIDPTK